MIPTDPSIIIPLLPIVRLRVNTDAKLDLN